MAVFSDSSDSEDDQQMKQFLEATDTTLLNNNLYGEKSEQQEESPDHVQLNTNNHQPKSQRYLPEDEENHFNSDFNLPTSVQEHIAKKLTALIEKQVEFCEINGGNVNGKEKKYKSKVKLLSDSECYVKTYEEFEYDTKGPQKKPEIKRRRVGEEAADVNEQLSQAAVTGQRILSGEECEMWAPKPERPHKVFHYKGDSKGNLMAQEPTNEFTPIRRKNKWNETKIKQKIKK